MPERHDAAVLPAGVVHVRTTDVFDADTVPAGLLRAHRIADGVWGRIVVHDGAVTFVFEDAPDRPIRLTEGDALVIPPSRLHHVEPAPSARFAVEFHRHAPGPVGAPVDRRGGTRDADR